MKTIFLIDDHLLIIESLKLLLKQSNKYDVVGTTCNSDLAIQQIKQTNPDIVIVDVSMPTVDGFILVPEIKKVFPHIKIIVYTMHALDRYYNYFINQNVDGYVLKSGEYGTIIDAVDVVSKNGKFLSKTSHFNNIESEENQIQFNKQEILIIELLIKDYTSQEIATYLGLSLNEIMNLRKNLILKTGCQTTTELIEKYKKLNQ